MRLKQKKKQALDKESIIYNAICIAKEKEEKLLAVLIDPDKVDISNLGSFFQKVNASIITHVFVGGSTDEHDKIHEVIATIKQLTTLPILIFPGSHEQITAKADAILFLSLLSGENPEYLITQHIKAVPKLLETNLEVLSTGYLLIDGEKETAVQKVSKTKPLSQNNIEKIVHTALAGQYLGNKLIYLEAGSGAKKEVSAAIIKAVKVKLQIPLIVGGGIRSKDKIAQAFTSGADLVVIGTAFEEDETFFNELKA